MNWFNYGTANTVNGSTLAFNVGTLTVWFSYKTPIAFRVSGKDVVMLDYRDSRSTSRHLNLIQKNNPTGKRVTKAEFDNLWQKQVQVHLDRLC